MYRVRFHLQRGPNYMHWQVRGRDGSLRYVRPGDHDVEMTGCTLVSKENAAKRVHAAGVKDVCGWVECESFALHAPGTLPAFHLERLYYNPIRDAHWRRSGDGGDFSWDGCRFATLVTSGRAIFVLEEQED